MFVYSASYEESHVIGGHLEIWPPSWNFTWKIGQNHLEYPDEQLCQMRSFLHHLQDLGGILTVICSTNSQTVTEVTW